MLLTENQRSQMQNDGWNKRYHFEKSIQNLYDYFENIHSLYDLCASSHYISISEKFVRSLNSFWCSQVTFYEALWNFIQQENWPYVLFGM